MQENLMLASTEADALAAERLVARHAELDGALRVKVETVVRSVGSQSRDAVASARRSVWEWCRSELLPHINAIETSVLPAAAGSAEASLLVEALIAGNRRIAELVDQVGNADHPLVTVRLLGSLQQAVSGHVTELDDQLVPALVAAPGVVLADLVAAVQSAESGGDPSAESATDDGFGHPVHEPSACGCNERDVSGFPELDARMVPHAIRHATVFGALDAVRPGKALILVAPHDPVPLLRQLEGREPGAFAVEYLQRGPEDWRLLLTRTAS